MALTVEHLEGFNKIVGFGLWEFLLSDCKDVGANIKSQYDHLKSYLIIDKVSLNHSVSQSSADNRFPNIGIDLNNYKNLITSRVESGVLTKHDLNMITCLINNANPAIAEMVIKTTNDILSDANIKYIKPDAISETLKVLFKANMVLSSSPYNDNVSNQKVVDVLHNIIITGIGPSHGKLNLISQQLDSRVGLYDLEIALSTKANSNIINDIFKINKRAIDNKKDKENTYISLGVLTCGALCFKSATSMAAASVVGLGSIFGAGVVGSTVGTVGALCFMNNNFYDKIKNSIGRINEIYDIKIQDKISLDRDAYNRSIAYKTIKHMVYSKNTPSDYEIVLKNYLIEKMADPAVTPNPALIMHLETQVGATAARISAEILNKLDLNKISKILSINDASIANTIATNNLSLDEIYTLTAIDSSNLLGGVKGGQAPSEILNEIKSNLAIKNKVPQKVFEFLDNPAVSQVNKDILLYAMSSLDLENPYSRHMEALANSINNNNFDLTHVQLAVSENVGLYAHATHEKSLLRRVFHAILNPIDTYNSFKESYAKPNSDTLARIESQSGGYNSISNATLAIHNNILIDLDASVNGYLNTALSRLKTIQTAAKNTLGMGNHPPTL